LDASTDDEWLGWIKNFSKLDILVGSIVKQGLVVADNPRDALHHGQRAANTQSGRSE